MSSMGSIKALPAAAIAIQPAGAATKKAVTVKVGDDYFVPDDLKVKKGTKVKWKWLPENGNPHNVTLEKGPKGVKKNDFKSETGSIGIKFSRTLEKKGTYDFVCTIHATVMKQTIRVKGS
jgi:plastocyanin